MSVCVEITPLVTDGELTVASEELAAIEIVGIVGDTAVLVVEVVGVVVDSTVLVRTTVSVCYANDRTGCVRLDRSRRCRRYRRWGSRYRVRYRGCIN